MTYRAAPTEAVEAALQVVADREATVRAWAYLDPELAREQARRATEGPLTGLTLGVKDIFDTVDQPSEYGSPMYAGHRPRADAAVVALLRRAGAAVLGKTVTAELAWTTPGPTTNPHRPTHTPGGSSSGSAAAVATGMVDLALGTQTAGSVLRPASFCGVFGLKPTFGLVPIAGIKAAAPSLDTVGFLARDVDVLEAALQASAHGVATDAGEEPRFVFVRTDEWPHAEAACQRVVESAAAALGAEEREMPASYVGLAEGQRLVQAFEGARSLASERREHPELLSSSLRETLDWGAEADPADYLAVMRRAAIGRERGSLDELFGAADVIVTAAVVGEAPEGLDFTGDPRFNRIWTLLGCPALSVPGSSGSSGLPIGVQLVARPYCESVLLRAGRLLGKLLGEQRAAG